MSRSKIIRTPTKARGGITAAEKTAMAAHMRRSYAIEDEMVAFAVASEHVTWAHGRGVTYADIARSVGIAPASRNILIAKLGRIWLQLNEAGVAEAA